jgi:hypothetical protein
MSQRESDFLLAWNVVNVSSRMRLIAGERKMERMRTSMRSSKVEGGLN